MKRFLSDLIWDTRGDTAVIFSISALAIFLGCGAAVDYSRWNNANTTASTVADAAALAAVASADAGEATMIAVAQKYIEENAAAAKLTLTTDPTFTYDKTTTEFTVELEGSIPASLMSLAGFSTLDVKAKSVAVKPEIPPVEMALVLDTTGSMAGTKIAALKTSADKMVTSVLKNKKAKKTAKSGYAIAMRERAKALRAEAKELKAQAKAASSSASADQLKAQADEKLRVAKEMEASIRRSGLQTAAPGNEDFGLSNN
jgi:Flp pilus assembly protein TadG